MIYVLGIDPGYSNGALCILSEDHNTVIFHDINDKSKRWHDPLIKFFKDYKAIIDYIAIEKVGTSMRQGNVSAGKFKGSAMVLETLAALTDIPYEVVVPTKWYERRGVDFVRKENDPDASPEEREKTYRKNKYDLKKSTFYWAKSKFPAAELGNFTDDKDRADALGIAYYALQQAKSMKTIEEKAFVV